MHAHFLEPPRNYTFYVIMFSFNPHMPNCVIVVQVYIFSLMFVSVFAANCSIVALGNTFLYMYNGIIFPSLPMSTLYGTVFMTLFDDVFRFAIFWNDWNIIRWN